MTETKKPRRSRRPVRKFFRPVRHWLVLNGYRAAMRVCARLSHRGAVRLGRWAGWAAGFVALGERSKIIANLELAYGDRMSAREKRRIARQCIESTCMMAAEGMNSLKWSAEEYLEAVAFEGDENWRAALAPGRGSIFLTGHIGSWEIMPGAFFHHAGIAFGITMRATRIPELTRTIIESRSGCGNPIFMVEDSALGLIRHLKKGGAFSIMGDQATPRLRGVATTFFGVPAFSPVGPAYIARRTGASIMPAFIHRRGDDPMRHVIRLYPPIFSNPALPEREDTRRIMQEYNDLLEAEVRANPEQWSWMHERWRHVPDEEEEVSE